MRFGHNQSLLFLVNFIMTFSQLLRGRWWLVRGENVIVTLQTFQIHSIFVNWRYKSKCCLIGFSATLLNENWHSYWHEPNEILSHWPLFTRSRLISVGLNATVLKFICVFSCATGSTKFVLVYSNKPLDILSKHKLLKVHPQVRLGKNFFLPERFTAIFLSVDLLFLLRSVIMTIKINFAVDHLGCTFF